MYTLLTIVQRRHWTYLWICAIFFASVLAPFEVHTQTIGEACGPGFSCLDGFCDNTRGVGGICICMDDTDCPLGTTCLVDQCLALVDNCTQDSDCETNQVCASSGICQERISGFDCRTNADCAPGRECRQETCVLPTQSSSVIRQELNTLNKLSARSIPELIGKGIRLFTGIFGSIALIMVIYGGLQIMVARGQGDKVKQGAAIIVWASIGLVTMMLSYLLVSFVFGAIT